MGIMEPDPKKPLLLFTSFPAEGHTGPLLAIAKHMVLQNYPVVYVSNLSRKDKITSLGAELIEAEYGFAEMTGVDGDAEEQILLEAVPVRIKRQYSLLADIVFNSMGQRVDAVESALELLRRREPVRQIIVVEDIVNMSTMPYRHGRALPAGFDKMPKTVGISTHPLMRHSRDTGPFLLGLPPDATNSGRLRNTALNDLVVLGPMQPLLEAWAEAMLKCGCAKVTDGNPISAMYDYHDATLMLCSPSLEYPMSDLPSRLHFVGCLPHRGVDSKTVYPGWWPEVSQAHTRGIKVVFVSQGTFNIKDMNELIIPTLTALAGREDVLVIATLGAKGAQLDLAYPVPANARVTDYIPYDAILPYTSVFVSNAGYGAFGHAVMNGVPAVFAGETEDKLEVAKRAEWAGFAYNVDTQTPSPEQVRQGVDTVLANDAYKKRALELKEENEAMDALTRIESHIASFAEMNL